MGGDGHFTQLASYMQSGVLIGGILLSVLLDNQLVVGRFGPFREFLQVREIQPKRWPSDSAIRRTSH